MTQRIAVFGGTGYAGSSIAREAVTRGHEVVSFTRSQPSEPLESVDYRVGSLADAATVSAAAEEFDTVVVATHGRDVAGHPLADLVPGIASALAGRSRLAVVGGAGSLFAYEGGPRVLDTPDFPDAYKPEATAHAQVLDALRADDSELDWFYVSPPALFGAAVPGNTTGSYRTNGDVLVADADGNSEISGADFALAVLDEIETPTHRNRRFSVGH